MKAITLAITLIYCTAPVPSTGETKRYDYMMGFVEWQITIPGGRGYFSVGCGSKPCYFNASRSTINKRFFLSPYTTRRFYVPMAKPKYWLVHVLQIQTEQEINVMAGMFGQGLIYDLYPVYPLESTDTVYFFNSPEKTSFIMMFTASYNQVQISCLYLKKKFLMFRKVIYRKYGTFFDLQQCHNSDVSVRAFTSPPVPFVVYYGTNIVQRCLRSAPFGGTRFLMAGPEALSSVRVTFIGLHPATNIEYYTDTGPRHQSSVDRTSGWWKDLQTGVAQKAVTISFLTLFVRSSKDILVSVRYKRPGSPRESSMSLAPTRCYGLYSYTLMPEYPAKGTITHWLILIAKRDLIDHIMVDGSYYFHPGPDRWPLIKGSSEYTWLRLDQSRLRVINVTGAYMNPGLMYVILFGTSSRGDYMAEAGYYLSKQGRSDDAVVDFMKSAEDEDSNSDVVLPLVLPLVVLLYVVVMVAAAWILIVSKKGRRQPDDQPDGGDEPKKSTSGGEQHEETPAEDDDDDGTARF